MAGHIASLKNVLHQMRRSSVHGIDYVLEVDSGKPGPTAAIIACTHGNEPVGLAAIRYLLDDLELLQGKLLFIIGNPEATECYFDAQLR